MILDDTVNPRVQAHAAAALVNFSDDCPESILASYLDDILAKLEAVLASKLREVGSVLYPTCLPVVNKYSVSHEESVQVLVGDHCRIVLKLKMFACCRCSFYLR